MEEFSRTEIVEEKQQSQQQPETVLSPPKGAVVDMYLLRFGKIFFNMFVTMFALTIADILGMFFLPIIYLLVLLIAFFLLIMVVIISLGTVFIHENNLASKIYNFITAMSNADVMTKIMDFASKAIPYLCIICLALAALGLLFLSISKQKGKTTKIVLLSIFAVIIIVILCLYYVLGGGV